MESNAKAVLLEPGTGESITLGGSIFTFKASGEQTSGGYAAIEYRAAPGAGSPMHRHLNEDEAFYILEGTLTFQLGEETVEASEGAFVLIPRGLRHAFTNRSAAPMRALITVSPPGLERYFQELGALISQSADDPALGDRVEALNQRYGLEFEPPS